MVTNLRSLQQKLKETLTFLLFMNQNNTLDDLFEESYWVVIRFNLEERKGLNGE